MMRMLETVRDWFYPFPKNTSLVVIDTNKPYFPKTDNNKITEKLHQFRHQYAAYQSSDGFMFAGVIAVDALLLYSELTPRWLTAILNIAFGVYGAPWFRAQFREVHDVILDDLMKVYKWMAVACTPSVTAVEKLQDVEQPNMYLNVVSVLALYYNASELNVWGERKGEFSAQYWEILRQAPHYKTPLLHSPDPVEPSMSSVVLLTKAMIRHKLYAPTKKVVKQENGGQEQVQPVQTPQTNAMNDTLEYAFRKGFSAISSVQHYVRTSPPANNATPSLTKKSE